MADITKIIFTTKEAYEQKVSSGTLEEGVVYAIDAAQSVDKKEVKAAIDTGFEKFGLSLGIDEEKAKFYDISLSLVDMIKDSVKEKIDANYLNDTRKLAGNETRDVKVSNVLKNSIITVSQDGRDLGMVKYDLTEQTNQPRPMGPPGVTANPAYIGIIHLPESLDLTKGFKVKLSNIFDTKTNTITFVPSFEDIVKDVIDEVVDDIDFDAPDMLSRGDYGEIGGLRHHIRYYQDTELSKQQFRQDINYTLSNTHTTFVAISDKAMIDPDVLSLLDKRLTTTSPYIVFTDLGLAEYYDSVTNTWKAMPQSKNTILTKLRKYTHYPFNSASINDAKISEILSRVNLSSINTNSKKELEEADISSADENEVANAEILVYEESDTENFVNSLLRLNNRKPLKVKVIIFKSNITQSTINLLNNLPTLQLVKMQNYTEKFGIPDNFKPVLFSNTSYDMYIEPIEGIGAYVKAPDDVAVTIRSIN